MGELIQSMAQAIADAISTPPTSDPVPIIVATIQELFEDQQKEKRALEGQAVRAKRQNAIDAAKALDFDRVQNERNTARHDIRMEHNRIQELRLLYEKLPPPPQRESEKNKVLRSDFRELLYKEIDYSASDDEAESNAHAEEMYAEMRACHYGGNEGG